MEIGSSFGMTTQILYEKSLSVVGIDISEELVQKTQERLPRVRFECLDAVKDTLGLMKLAKWDGVVREDGVLVEGEEVMCNCVFVDIGGNREIEMVALLLESVTTRIKPYLIVIKSEELFQHARQFCESIGSVGSFADSPEWRDSLSNMIQLKKNKLSRLHPLKQTPRSNPDGILICRYHNYQRCKKAELCQFDHIHCNECGKPGHTAKQCQPFK
uniref:CCHC-type domain-containing protein n=1 Tax=Arcella intermedia TaxID=1963864 RepID=A0A6B2LGS1_9EUKA